MAEYNKFPTYCRTGSIPGAVITCTVNIYRQCSNSLEDAGALIKRIRPADQVGGSGVTVTSNAEYTEILTADSVKSRAKLFAANAPEYKVNIQNDAFDPVYDQMEYNLDFEEDPDRQGYSFMLKGDQVGKLSPRFSVGFSYMSAGVEIGFDWCPDSEIMISNRGAMAAGQIYKSEMSVMPQVYDDLGSRVYCQRPTNLVKGSVLPF
jgi:hypothetical protein